MDIEEKDTIDSFVTASGGLPINVSNTANRFANRNLDSSFAAAYFPDVVITDPATDTNVQCPPTVAVLGALSYNDSVAHPWYAPAGFNRGALKSVVESQVKLNQANLDDLYEVDINPIASFGHTSDIVVFGQKTVLANKSSLDRVNVRRLLIEIRRRVRAVANSLLFEPNRESTLAKFSSLVNPILGQIQAQQGLDRYKVQIDTSTTTQADVENNTIRGKVFLQPTRSVEFIALDFVVTNAGSDI
jgi:phage tail sheath protein FI